MKNRYKILLGVLAIAGIVGLYASQVSAATTTVVFTTNGTWTAPAGVTVVQVSAWAGGASTNTANSGAGAKSGAGGGAYSALNAFTVIPGNTYTVVVGKAGISASNGGDSMFSASSTLLAKGGVFSSTSTGGAGGASASGAGDVTFSGGSGGNATASVSGGGGGGGAGTSGNGGNASANVGGTGATVGGGNGGSGGVGDGTNGTAGSARGGGGGGGSFDTGGGKLGAAGEVDITYTLPPISAKVIIANSKVIIGNSKVIIK